MTKPKGGAIEAEIASYANVCHYCGAQPGEACRNQRKRRTWCKRPHPHRQVRRG